MKKKMTLREFIDEYGQINIAYALGVTPSIVCRWRSGDRRPSPESVQAMIELSKGRLSFDSVYAIDQLEMDV